MAESEIIFKSNRPDVDIPEVPLTDYILDGLSEDVAEKPALIDGVAGRKYTCKYLILLPFPRVEIHVFGLRCSRPVEAHDLQVRQHTEEPWLPEGRRFGHPRSQPARIPHHLPRMFGSWWYRDHQQVSGFSCVVQRHQSYPKSLSPLYKQEELHHQFELTKPKFLVTIPNFKDVSMAVAKETSVEKVHKRFGLRILSL